MFDAISLSKYSPIDSLKDLIKIGLISWTTVLKRNDLTRKFIISNFTKFDILKLDYTYYGNYDLMVKKLTTHTYSDYSYIIINLLKTQKYSYTELTNLLSIIVSKNKYIHIQNYDMFEIIKLYIQKYYKVHNYTSLNELKKFIEYFNISLAANQTIYTSNCLIENLINKLSEYDMDYLLKHKLICYYTGSLKLPKNTIQYFYNKRYILLDGNINPFIMKGYTFNEVEELIKFYISMGIKKSTIFKKMSKNIIDFNTPYWFLKKYETSIYWDFAFENMINNIQEQDIEKLMQLIVDFSEIIKIQCIDVINDTGTTLILPDEVIIYYIDSLKKQIPHILSYQKLSIETLVYMLTNKYVTPNCLKYISSFQNLDSEFIAKYKSVLDENLLKYNPSITSDTSDLEKCTELEKYNISYTINEGYLIIDVSYFGVINHKLNDTYKTIYTDLNKQLYTQNINSLDESKNNLYYSINKKNKNQTKMNVFNPILPYDKRNKVVFNNNPVNMDGNILSFNENSLLWFKEIKYELKPMIYLDVNKNTNTKFKVKVPIRDTLIVSKPFQHFTENKFITKYNIYIYLPYGTLIEFL
jgi:hypothetical protein